MRQTSILALLLLGLVGAAAVLLPDWTGETEAPVVRWSAADEVAIEAPADAATGDMGGGFGDAGMRQDAGPIEDLDLGERAEVLLRGRVVNRFRAPVADAKVYLDFGRGGPRGRQGRDRRVPEPVVTDRDGRFAFQGQTFRNLRVSLLVAHPQHAPSTFDRNLGEVGAELDLGELQIQDGGALSGRVVDFGGNGIPFASVRLQPAGGNGFRMQQVRGADQDATLPTDANGWYRFDHVADGDWRIAATAKGHENGESDTVAAADLAVTEVDDIRLGPGFELAGIVLDAAGQPIADAEVTARPRNNQGRGGPGGPGGRGGRGGPFGGADLSTKTDADGRFFLEHLPDSLLDLSAQKKGYLSAQLAELDPEQTQPVYLTLQDGLSLRGVVTDAVSQAPVVRYAVTVRWQRPLPIAGVSEADFGQLMQRMRDGSLDEATRNQLRQQMESMRQQMRDSGGGRGGRGGPFAQAGDAGGRGRSARLQRHDDGAFVETGLQEGVYTVTIESDQHCEQRVEQIEVRAGAPAPEVQIRLERGFVVAGIVRGPNGQPLANADVELRRAQAEEPGAREASPQEASARGGRGGRGFAMAMGMTNQGSVETARTDKEGRFTIAHAPAGRYVVTARARLHEEAKTEPFALQKDLDSVQLALVRRGSLSGQVLGATPAELAEVRVVAAPIGEDLDLRQMFRGGGQPFASVSADGAYRFDELRAGNYAVRAFLGSQMRELMLEYTGGKMAADVVIQDGEDAALDVTLQASRTGIVRGSVLHNASPASGFQVTLQSGDAPADQGPGQFGGRGGRGGFGARSLAARIDGQGNFEIKDVPAGSYTLAVSADRRGGAPLHQETIYLGPKGVFEAHLTVATTKIQGRVAVTDGTPLAEIDGAVQLVPAALANQETQGQRGNPNQFRARVTDGTFEIANLPQGDYALTLTVRGRARTHVEVHAVLGQDTTVLLPLGEVDPQANQRRGGAQPGGNNAGTAPQQGGRGRTAPGGQQNGATRGGQQAPGGRPQRGG